MNNKPAFINQAVSDAIEQDRASMKNSPGSLSDREANVERIPRDQHGHRGIRTMEAFHKTCGEHKYLMWGFYVAIGIFLFASNLQSSTTYVYQTYAVSDFEHHGQLLGIIFTVTPIIQAITQPFIAKLCDMGSRQTGYTFATIMTTIGFIVMPTAKNGYAFAAGAIISSVGLSGITLTTTILLGDISPLQWRSFANGLASFWYIIVPWFGAKLSTTVGLQNWRWGYGMFAIIIPVCMAPILILLFWAEFVGKKNGDLVTHTDENREQKTFLQILFEFVNDLDLIGLLLLAFAWSLMFLPFSLSTGAVGGWKNASMIAMIVCGVVIFFLFAAWEKWMAKNPMLNRELVRNRVFLAGVGIDFLYFFTGYLRDTYYLTYVLLVKDWDTVQWTNFSQTFTVSICFFSIVVGLLMAYTHRYKYIQLGGILIRILGLSLTVLGVDQRIPSTTLLVFQQVLIGLGSSCSVLGTQTATQASVSHSNLSQMIAQLSLWTQLGGSVGSAITAQIWTTNLPKNFIRAGISPEQAAELFGSPVTIATFPYNEPLRQMCIDALNWTVRPLFLSAAVVSILCFVCGLVMPNYYLGNTHNAVEGTDIAGRVIDDDNVAKNTIKTANNRS